MAGKVQHDMSIDKDAGIFALSLCRKSVHMNEVECPAEVSARSPSHTSTSKNEAGHPWADCSPDIATAASVAGRTCLTVQQLRRHSRTIA